MLLSTKRNFGGNLFDDFFNDPFFNSAPERQTALMRTDIEDEGANYILEIELPGYKKDNVSAQLKDGYLTITAETASSADQSDADKNYIRKERYSGSCKRTFFVGADLRQEDIKASFDQGILRLTVPKEAPKQVEENHFITIE